MRLLLHVGLNKCASTYIQDRLAASTDVLAQAGVFYPRDQGRTCHYGLSRHYGFGPDARHVRAHGLASYLRLARRQGAQAVILSSEYLSLNRPKAMARLMADMRTQRLTPKVLFFARPVEPWVRSLFNQYVRTVDGPRYLASIDAYVDQVMANRAIDIAGRYRAWEAAVGGANIHLIDIVEGAPPDSVLTPFEHFAGVLLRDRPVDTGGDANRSTSPGILFMLGLVRRAPHSAARSRLIETLLGLDPGLASMIPAPPGYMDISPDRRSRLEREIAAPFAALPRVPLVPQPADMAAAE